MVDQSGQSLTPTTPALVGRDRELTALHEVLAAALCRRGALVFIGGEAGIGKSALAEALRGRARGRQFGSEYRPEPAPSPH